MKTRMLSFRSLTVVGTVLAAGTLLTAPPAPAAPTPSCDNFTSAGSTGVLTCQASGAGEYVVTLTGAGGGGASGAAVTSRGGHGAIATGRITVTAGQTLTIEVGTGGGSAGAGKEDGAGGGGWTAVKDGATILAVAAGGGGAGSYGGTVDGGDGAAANTAAGGPGQSNNADLQGGAGGAASAGGAGGLCTSGCAGPMYNGDGGSQGAGGNGADPLQPPNNAGKGASGWQGGAAGTSAMFGTGGGGGAGAYGGGGGSARWFALGAGGGAGSSYFPAGTFTTGSNGGATGTAGGDGSISFSALQQPGPAPAPAPVTVTVGLNLNGGTGAVAALSGDQGTWATLPTGAGLARPGYVFAGWNTAANGSGASYAPGASVQLTGDNTLFAQWRVASTPGTGGQTSPSPSASASGEPKPTPISLPPGGSQLLVNGVVAPVTVRPNVSSVQQATGLTISGDGFTMSLAGRGDASDPLGLTPKQALILQSEQFPGTRSRAAIEARAKAKPVAQSGGTGFKANTTVRLTLLPATTLGEIATDGAGVYQGSVPIPRGITPGDYTLQVNGYAPSGQVRSLSIGVVVTAAPQRAVATVSVTFVPLSATLTSASKAALRTLVKKTGTKATSVRCIGFVQALGSVANDESLSAARARNVADYLRSLGLTGRYVVRGDGRADARGSSARRVDVTVIYAGR